MKLRYASCFNGPRALARTTYLPIKTSNITSSPPTILFVLIVIRPRSYSDRRLAGSAFKGILQVVEYREKCMLSDEFSYCIITNSCALEEDT